MASDAPTWADGVENPYLHGIYGPTTRFADDADLEVVEGELPRDLFGVYVRNGPNAMTQPPNLYHWFDGDGLVNGVYFRDGKAEHRSRLVETSALHAEADAGKAIWPGVMGPFDTALMEADAPRPYIKDTANTDLIWHAGDLLALWYLCGTPYRLDPRTLETRGTSDFGGKLHTSVSAHPKRDERTGELVWFTLAEFAPPYMTYGVVDADGELVHETPIDLPGARAPHDLTITENFSIVHDLPLFHDIDILRKHGYRVGRFHRDIPSRYGVLPRRGDGGDVKWFEFEPGYVLHMVNAWEEGDWIVMDGCFQPDPTIEKRPEDGELASMLGYLRIKAHLRRWKMNLVTGETREEQLDDLNVEFPLPDTALYGEKTRYSYHQHLPEDMHTVDFRALVKYDHETGARTRFDYDDGWSAGEAAFAPRVGAKSEDDGYVVTVASEYGSKRSQAWVFDAQAIERGPVARVALRTRVPTGFHAKWITGDRVFEA